MPFRKVSVGGFMERADEREKSVREISWVAGAHGWALGLVTVLGRIVTDP